MIKINSVTKKSKLLKYLLSIKCSPNLEIELEQQKIQIQKC